MLGRFGRFTLILIATLQLLLNIKANPSVSNSVAIDNNNKIVIGGFFDNGQTTDFLLIRYLQDGALDSTFNSGGPIPGIVITPISNGSDAINSITIDNNNKIVVAGFSNSAANTTSDSAGGTSDFTVARYNDDGSLDRSFNPEGIIPGVVITPINDFINIANSVVIDNNNKIVAAGITNNGMFTSFLVVRYNDDGSLDQTFNSAITPGFVITNTSETTIQDEFSVDSSNDGATSVTIDNSNKIVAAGFAGDLFTNVAVIRYNDDGTLDTTFNPTGILPSPLGPVGPRPGIVITPVNNSSEANAVTIDNNNKIVIAGETTPLRQELAIIETSNIVSNEGNSEFLVIRYNDDGSLDTTLNSTTLPTSVGPVPGIVTTDIAGFGAVAKGVTIDNNNKIVTTGFSGNGTITRFTTVRYNNDGTLDTTFNPAATTNFATLPIGSRPGVVITQLSVINFQISQNIGNEQSHAVVIDNNNKIVITGFSNDGAQNNATTIRYNNDGTLDATLNQASLTQTQNFPQGTIPGVVITEINLFDQTPQNILGYRVDDLLPIAMNVTSPLLDTLISSGQPFKTPLIALPDEGIITNNTNLVIDGLARPYDLVTITINDVPIVTAQADSIGRWIAFLPPLIDGNYIIAAVVIDQVTDLILKSPIKSIVIDTIAPEPPIVVTPAPNIFSKEKNVLITGTTKASAVVTIYVNDRAIVSVPVDNTGKWAANIALPSDGKYALFVIAADYAGNVSLPSKIQFFVIDSVASKAPIIRTPVNNTVSIKPNIAIAGNSKPHVPVNIIVDDKQIGTVVANSHGSWKFIAQLKDGKQKIKAQIKDPFNDALLDSNIISVEFKGKENSSVTAAQTQVESKNHTVSGMAAPNSEVLIMLDEKKLGTATADSTGKWRFVIPENINNIGLRKITALIHDQNGNSRIVRSG